MWDASTDAPGSEGVRRFVLRRDGSSLCYADVIALWRNDHSFRSFFISLFAAAPFDAFLWECPPVSATTADRSYEFVLVDCPPLATLPAEMEPFGRHFAGAEEEIVTFW